MGSDESEYLRGDGRRISPSELRRLAAEWWECCDDIHEPLLRAADEIERLQRVVDVLKPFAQYANGGSGYKLLEALCELEDSDVGKDQASDQENLP